jgi:dipeptidase E
MRYYLSSFKLGDHAHKLPELAGYHACAGIIANAQDHLDEASRQNNIDEAHQGLNALGFSTQVFDLRDYFDDTGSLKDDLAGYDLLWAIGGSAFVLRSAMALSGFDQVIHELLGQDRLVYGGYSAGVCVLAPHLYGLELCDDTDAVAKAYGADLIWDGLNILDYAIVPHYDSDHHEAEFAKDMVAYYEANALAYRALRDGDVLIRNGETVELLPRTRPAPQTAPGNAASPGPDAGR